MRNGAPSVREPVATRRIESLQRTLASRELLLTILAHDLRSPLAAARVSAELILRSSSDERALGAARRVVSASGRMQRLIEQLLDLARVRAGRELLLRRRSSDLGRICEAAVEEIRAASPEARVSVVRHGALRGRFDPDRLAQLVVNLVVNAVRHGAAHGAAHGAVLVVLDGSDRACVRLSVHNEGTVSPAVRPRLFEPFASLEAADARPVGKQGLGLGLFIVRAIARAHGGDVGFSSGARQGTTFVVSLPRAAGARL